MQSAVPLGLNPMPCKDSLLQEGMGDQCWMNSGL